MAALCATQLSGEKCKMDGFRDFRIGPYNRVSDKYAAMCEKICDRTRAEPVRVRCSELARCLRGDAKAEDVKLET